MLNMLQKDVFSFPDASLIPQMVESSTSSSSSSDSKIGSDQQNNNNTQVEVFSNENDLDEILPFATKIECQTNVNCCNRTTFPHHASIKPVTLITNIFDPSLNSSFPITLPSPTTAVYNGECSSSGNVSSTVVEAVSKGCSNAAVCITEAQRRASDILCSTFATAAGFLGRPLTTSMVNSRRALLEINKLIEGGIPEIVVLGHSYRIDKSIEKEAFFEDYHSRVLFTYRRNFIAFDDDVEDSTFSKDIDKPRLCYPPTTRVQLHLDNETTNTRHRREDDDNCNHIDPTSPSTSSSKPPNPPLISQVNITPGSTPFFQRALACNRSGKIISDAGWGCMIRVTQMAFAQSLINLRLGRDWRRRKRRRPEDARGVSQSVVEQEIYTATPNSPSYRSGLSLFEPAHVFTDIISNFFDHPDYPLSVHSISRLSQVLFETPMGQWLGPTSCAQAAAVLMTSPRFSSKFPDVTPIVFPDGLLIHSVVKSAFGQLIDTSQNIEREKNIVPLATGKTTIEHDEKMYQCYKSVLIILCMRLGNECFNTDRYRFPLASCFRFPQFQGLAGGGSLTSAYYFFGTCAQGLLFLDPHIAIQTAFCPGEKKNHCTENTSKSVANVMNEFQQQPQDSTSSIESIQVPSTNPVASNQALSSVSTDNNYVHLVSPAEVQLFPSVDNSFEFGPSVLSWSLLNPSMALYFLCRTPEEYEDLVVRLQLASQNVPEIFEMRDAPLDFSRVANVELDQFNIDNLVEDGEF